MSSFNASDFMIQTFNLKICFKEVKAAAIQYQYYYAFFTMSSILY